jgi:branched-chain amino acid transport system substrate-binding protein
VAATLLGAAACSSGKDSADDASSTSTTVDTAQVLGAKNPAKGEPVLVGFVNDGRGPAMDNSYQSVAADGVVKYINEYMGGIAGRPIDLVKCETQFEPGKATDCANELVQKGVVAVMMPESTAALAVFKVMKDDGVPLFTYGVGDSALLLDSSVMFSLADPVAGLSDSPIEVAKENNLKKVTAVVVDVPAATSFYKTIAPDTFKKAGIDLEVIAIPPDQADMTPQMTQIANGGPTVVHIVGQDTFCISAINGLDATGFKGPISMLSGTCQTEAVKKAVGAKLKGVYVSSATANGDSNAPGIQQWNAIVDKYEVDADRDQSLPTFITVMSMRLALEGLTGEVSKQSINSTIRAMKAIPLPGGAGLLYRCNSKAVPILPAVCTNGNLVAQLNAKGEAVLPWKVVGNQPIPD